MVVCNNDMQENFACNMIQQILELCYTIDSFYAINHCSTKRPTNKFVKNDDGLVWQDILTPSKCNTLKKFFDLTKTFCNFIIWIKSCATTGL